MSDKPIPEAWMTPGGDVSRSFYWCLERCLPGQQPRPLFAAQQQGRLDVGSPRTPEQIAATVAWVQSLADSDIAPQPMQQGGREVVQRHVVTKYRDGSAHVADVTAPPSAPVGDVGEIMHNALCRIALGQEPAQTIADDAIAEARKAALAPPPPAEQREAVRYDAGLLSDYGGGDVNWWWDYIRAELERAHDFYTEALAQQPAAAPGAKGVA